jgi:predicted MPP superfamily phosphohydrolase/uncharacterized membrane protein
MQVLLFLLALTFQASLYYYVWRRLIRDTEIPHPWRRRLTLLLIVLIISVPLTIAARKISATVGQTIGWPVFLWMATTALTAVALLVIDSARFLRFASRHMTRRAQAPEDPDRRAFMRRVTGATALFSASTISGIGLVQSLRTPPLRDVPITLKRLPQSLDGFTIAQITDLHVGNTIGRSFVEAVVATVNRSNPDLIVITGDLVDGEVEFLEPEVAPLADLSARHGVFFVTGNHEYYSGADSWVEHLTSLGIRVLRNERVSIGEGEDSFDLAGIDDYNAGRWDGHGPDLESALAGRDTSRELVLLAHQPRQVHEATQYGVGLQLSGHTHGGQIWPWHYVAKTQQGGLLAGWSQHDETQLYVSSGTGYWGPPVRFLSRAEITRVTLRSAKV